MTKPDVALVSMPFAFQTCHPSASACLNRNWRQPDSRPESTISP